MVTMATPQLCLDSDVIVDYLRRRDNVLERALSRFNCAFTAVTVYELEIGLFRSPRQSTLFTDLLGIVAVLPLNYEAAHAAAQVYEKLRGQGLLIGVQDTLIAGTCIAHGLPLLTRNVEHYGRIGGLTIIEAEQVP